MSDKPMDYGILIKPGIKLHRKWFKQMVKMIGINCLYRAPKPGKTHDKYGDLDAKYELPETVGVIFQDHPDQKTLKKMGWVAELQEGSSIIHVPYDLHGLQEGALFQLPSGLDNAEGRWFRVISMSNIMIYPASIACEIAPEYVDLDDKAVHVDFSTETVTLLRDDEDDD